MRIALKKILRSPKVIVGEILALALLCVIGASLPQAGSATDAELARLNNAGPVVADLIKAFSLDHVFRSGWFCAATLLATASLWVVTLEQFRRLRLAWKQRHEPSQFRSAPFQMEFERPAQLAQAEPLLKLWTENRAGVAGSALLHLGLLFVICAGTLRALFSAQAVADLVEGETLPPTATGWSAQWPGLIAGPIRFASPVRLDRVDVNFYETGDLRELKVNLAVSSNGVERQEQVAVNRDLRLSGGRMYVGSDVGPAALLEWEQAGLAPAREAVLLADKGQRRYEGVSSGANGMRAHLRTQVDTAGNQPSVLEVRVMKGNALILTTVARAGDILQLPNGEKLSLRGMPFWARLRGGRDSSLWLAYSGFAFIMAGAVLIFAVIRVDGCVVITPLGDRERVFVALKPQRLVPLFQERFQRLVRQHGGPETVVAMISAPEPARVEDQREPHSCGDNCRGCVRRALTGPCPESRASGVALGIILLLGLVGVTGCGPSAAGEARSLVQRYNSIVAEAYRRGDVKLIDPVVGPKEGKKIAGLIGVRLDLGLTLDSHLLSLEISSVDRRPDEWRVRTREQWRYRDLRIGTGEQVGEESLDSYEMLYVFKKSDEDQAWLVDEIQFISEPIIGRKTPTWAGERAPLRGHAGDKTGEPRS